MIVLIVVVSLIATGGLLCVRHFLGTNSASAYVDLMIAIAVLLVGFSNLSLSKKVKDLEKKVDELTKK